MKKINDIRIEFGGMFDIREIDILLAEAINKNTAFILAHPEYKLNIFERRKVRIFFQRLKKGWPIAYILGHKEFFGLDFLVDRHTLIPRPETELMVEEVAKFIANSSQPIVLMDIGTGSGCVPIAIEKTIINKAVQIYATDISHGALRVAKKNARRHGVKINFLHGDLLEPLKNYWLRTIGRELIITANLPYLTAEQFANEPSIQREPKSALVADHQGLALYEKLLKQINFLISNLEVSKFPNISIFLEIDPSQSKKISEIISNILPRANIQIKTDLALRDRLVKITC